MQGKDRRKRVPEEILKLQIQPRLVPSLPSHCLNHSEQQVLYMQPKHSNLHSSYATADFIFFTAVTGITSYLFCMSLLTFWPFLFSPARLAGTRSCLFCSSLWSPSLGQYLVQGNARQMFLDEWKHKSYKNVTLRKLLKITLLTD